MESVDMTTEAMKYGQICAAPGRNAAIYECLKYLCDEDAKKFVKKFGEQPHHGQQVMHTFQELVVGAHLLKHGIPARYDMDVDGKTPDWCIGHPDVKGVIEVVNHHASRDTEKKIYAELRQQWMTAWSLDSGTQRLYSTLWDKATKYKSILEARTIPYIISVSKDLLTDVEQADIHECLTHSDHGLFHQYPSLSGVAFFIEGVWVDYFEYYPNPDASVTFDFPIEPFDLGVKSK
jgi:hypothetical protein